MGVAAGALVMVFLDPLGTFDAQTQSDLPNTSLLSSSGPVTLL